MRVYKVSKKSRMTAFTRACIEANREISRYLKEDFKLSLLQKEERGAGGDISSAADLLAEKIFVKHLSGFGRIESEESGVIGAGKSTVIIDPLDGSANFASGFPYYGTSVALLDADGRLEAAQVCNLASGDIFIKEHTKNLLTENLFASGYAPQIGMPDPELGLFEKAYTHPLIAAALLKAGYKFRSPGATALSLAYAHNVQFFLFVGQSRIYDIVAGLAICEGLEVIVEEDYVIVSQSKTFAKNIETIIRRSLV